MATKKKRFEKRQYSISLDDEIVRRIDAVTKQRWPHGYTSRSYAMMYLITMGLIAAERVEREIAKQ